jgi:hypothetical protein
MIATVTRTDLDELGDVVRLEVTFDPDDDTLAEQPPPRKTTVVVPLAQARRYPVGTRVEFTMRRAKEQD